MRSLRHWFRQTTPDQLISHMFVSMEWILLLLAFSAIIAAALLLLLLCCCHCCAAAAAYSHSAAAHEVLQSPHPPASSYGLCLYDNLLSFPVSSVKQIIIQGVWITDPDAKHAAAMPNNSYAVLQLVILMLSINKLVSFQKHSDWTVRAKLQMTMKSTAKWWQSDDICENYCCMTSRLPSRCDTLAVDLLPCISSTYLSAVCGCFQGLRGGCT